VDELLGFLRGVMADGTLSEGEAITLARLRREVGWGRLDRIRRLRKGGMTFEQARDQVDRDDQNALDQQNDWTLR
jgi:hypothetical protein